MNRTKNIRRRLRNRAGKRGAAMVEGIVIISGMLCFLGLILWTRQAWGTKLDLQQKTRSDVLYYASHACKETGGGNASSTQGTVPTSGGGNVSGVATRAGGANGAGAASSSFGKASASDNRNVIFQAAFNVGNPNGRIQYAKLPLRSQVTAASQTLCNEPKYGNTLVAFAQFAVNFFRSGGGVGSLFSN